MIVAPFAARFALVFSCVLTAGVAAPAQAGNLQCVPYAREVSGIAIRGNAGTWWAQAAGRYERAATPEAGSVMSFKATRAMPLGHVATVTRVVGAREVLLTHANWSRRGGVERDVRAVDVSAAGDWSEVRVWFAGTEALGTTSYPLNGFIRPGKGRGVIEPVPPASEAPLPTMTIATVAAVSVAAPVLVGAN